MTLGRWLTWCCYVALVACGKADSERALSFEVLSGGAVLDEPVKLVEFAPIGEFTAASNTFSGRLRLDTDVQANSLNLQLDSLSLVTADRPGIAELPPFDVEFVQDGEILVPMQQGPIDTGHEWWDLVLRPGRVWDESTDQGYSRAVIPFALKERREDCIHNGLMSFLFNDASGITDVAFQISNQTCGYMHLEMHGLLGATYEQGPVGGAREYTEQVRANRLGRLPQRPISTIEADFSGADASQFGSTEEIDPGDMSAFGFVIDGIHYVGGCDTPLGEYPYCDDMALPSYSMAKSLVGGLGLMLMEATYPGTAEARITDYVAECRDGWEGVTIEHALDMTTGHFGSSELHADENSSTTGRFFNGDDHATKIDYACNEYPRQLDPGLHIVYHTWDTYLAGTAINNHLKSIAGPEADFYDDMLVEKIWKPLGLSLLSQATRRTYDDVAQPFTAFGLTLVRDDIVRLAQFIGVQDGRLGGEELLDRALFDAIKQRVPGDSGHIAELDTIFYNNGFRSFDVSGYLGCEEPAWVVVLSGYGGIIVAIMPNDTVYYYFSDGYVHRYLHAVRESHKIRPMCS